MRRDWLQILLLSAAWGHLWTAVAYCDSLSFERDIQPILAEHCFACHGPDANHRQADLRLDTSEGLRVVVTPGNSQGSTLFQRVATNDPVLRMPPAKSHASLSGDQQALLRRWIDQGATWDEHWAFVPASRPAIPTDLPPRHSSRNPIDAFVQGRLWRNRLQSAAPEANRSELIRRVTLDLLGLPPEPQDVWQFVNDPSPDAYDRLVDRLLASPAFGERMAWDWLDAARYADSNGYQDDSDRTMWPWRDWVVQAFNQNLSYDKFTEWQIAGDLLPQATFEQTLATGFCRNHMINGEGGRIPEENRVEYVMDITETVGTVWLGLTLNCCRCHDHKFDPLTQAEYYQLFSFFNQTPIDGSGRDPQTPPVVEFVDTGTARSIDALQAQLDKPSETGRVQEKDQEELKRHLEQLRKLIPRVMVMADGSGRPTHILQRGQYNLPGRLVSPGVPGRLPPLDTAGPANRWALAKWITDPAHPLTSRVIVNRVWQQFFGVGLVKTVEDFGVQGERPLQRDVLDWLAAEFSGHEWDMKHLIRTIVTSHTYRQSSRFVAATAFDEDPENRWLSRGPRHRLPAWMLRDQALASAGLLVTRMGGAPVRGYQPPGVWEEATFGNRRYEQDHGASLYRRSLYTFWRRIVAPTVFFDTASRQVCSVRSSRTNTPLHALVTFNDVTYVEAARELARQILQMPAIDERQRMNELMLRTCARLMADAEATILQQGLQRTRDEYRQHPQAAQELVATGESRVSGHLDIVELASWTNLCLTVLNSDEVLSKE